jgi:hypothetical protein
VAAGVDVPDVRHVLFLEVYVRSLTDVDQHRCRRAKSLDLAIARNIRLGDTRRIQLRLDVFNAVNTVIYNDRVTTLLLHSPTDQMIEPVSICPTAASIRIARFRGTPDSAL